MRRIGRTAVTWPNVGELTTVSIDGELHGVEHVVGQHLQRQAARLAEA